MGSKGYSPLTVAKTVNRLLETGLLKTEPVWYQPVVHTPPMLNFSRKPAQTHHPRPRTIPNDIRKIQKIQGGLEMYLRKKFYKEHPWELARPRVAVEEDGADYVRQDWSKMPQVGKPLDGERLFCYCVTNIVL
jgi:small subunit ribosomal protein S23